MTAHLPLDVLALPASERSSRASDHLAVCPKCRVEARLMGLGEGGVVAPEIQQSMDAHRKQLTGQMQRSMNTVHHSSTWIGSFQTVADVDEQPESEHGLGAYQLNRWLGMSPDAVVHASVDKRSGQPCAVKIYHPSRKSMCPKQPLRTRIQTIRHRNLAMLLGGGHDEDKAFSVWECVDGPDLVTWIRDVGDAGLRDVGANLRRVRTSFQQVVAGLRALESMKLAHGRLHPDNIRVDGAGRVVLLDYGCPGPDGSTAAVPAWNPSMIYRAPEHRAAGGASIEGDLYSLGIVMAEALIGERPRHEAPFAGRTTDVPADLRYLVTELIQVDAADRPSLVEVGARLGIDKMPSEVRSDRYDDLGLLGSGGMGEVRRVLDRDLNRTLAMKVSKLETRPDRVARFVAEAQLTAQLQHPAIVPVHEMGRLANGQNYFTMKEIRGRDLGAVIRLYHGVSGSSADASGQAWSIHRLVQVLHQVCQAVAYAHSRGVVHRDLKPDNIMVGDYGEVLVVDWGIAKSLGTDTDTGEDPILTVGQGGSSAVTLAGTLSGTPSYMPPELFSRIGKAAHPSGDVYALGATLYHVLAGRPPFIGRSHEEVISQVMAGPPPPIVSACVSGHPIPDDLIAIAERAMARTQTDRPADAGEMAQMLGEWLDGVRARQRAALLVEQARTIYPDIARHQGQVALLKRQASQLLEQISKSAPVREKLSAWSLEDQAKQASLQATLVTVEYEKSLRGALSHVQNYPEAMELLAAHHQKLHAEAEAAHDLERCARHEAMLRAYDTGSFADYLRGKGAITIHTEPVAAQVTLQRYEEVDRRLVLGPISARMTTPIEQMSLDMGSYLITVESQGRTPVRLPIQVDRLGHHDGVAPDMDTPEPVYLPRTDRLQEDDVYVCAGWTILGGLNPTEDTLPRMNRWVDGFVIRRFPVTNREYIAFLDDLVAQDREDEALEHVPRERAATLAEPGVMIYGRTDSGQFELRPDADGDLWLPEMPVVMVSWFGAMTYAAWEADCSGLPWRLPWEMEWEKAARGADGRNFAWGDQLDPTFCCMRYSHTDRGMVATVDEYPVDESPYGVRGVCGNVIDWCMDAYQPGGLDGGKGRFKIPAVPGSSDDPIIRVIRGGGWVSKPGQVTAMARDLNDDFNRASYVGFRLARSLTDDD